MLKFTDQNFEAEVSKAELPVMVDFYAPWCVAPETNVSLANNFSLPAKDLTKETEVFGWKKGIARGKISYSRVVSDAGHCRLLKTTTGRKIKVTDDHLFYTSSGWKKAKQLQLGDKVAVFTIDETVFF
jgi:intein/homing endonuclease